MPFEIGKTSVIFPNLPKDNYPMKTNGLIIAFILVIIGVSEAIPGVAQPRNCVGVNLILKPIQTIHIEGNRDQPDRAEGSRVDRKEQNHYVTVFGTTNYQLAVDSVTIVNTSRTVEGILPHLILASKGIADSYSHYVQNKGNVRPGSLSPALVIYSIQVK